MGPIGGIRFIHNAIRSDLSGIAQEAASGGVAERFGFFRSVLRVHELAEEKHLFPAIDNAAPGTSDSYIANHRDNTALMDTLETALAAGDAKRASDTAGRLSADMNAHLDREEAELWPLCDQHIAPPDQGALIGRMAGEMPQSDMPRIVGWMMDNLSQDDRAGVVRMWQAGVPAPAFAGLLQLVKGSLTPADWSDLTQRVPGTA